MAFTSSRCQVPFPLSSRNILCVILLCIYNLGFSFLFTAFTLFDQTESHLGKIYFCASLILLETTDIVGSQEIELKDSLLNE